MCFPCDFWDSVRHAIGPDIREQAAALSKEIEHYFGGPRDIAFARRFLAEHLRKGRIYVYGAGTHSEAIYNDIIGRADVEVLGFLDRDAKRIKEFRGYPVLPPADVVGSDFDYILVSYNRIDDKIVGALLDLGIARDKIFTIYSNPDYISLYLQLYYDEIRRNISGYHFDYVIVRTGFYDIITEKLLGTIFPADRTLLVRIGASRTPTTGIFREVDVSECILAVSILLKEINPRLVYLSTAHEYDICSFIVRQAAPSARMIHEIYDFYTLIPNDWIELGLGVSPRVIELMRLGTYYSSQVADMIISKRSGPDWQRATETFRAPYCFVYPGIEARDASRQRDVNPPDKLPPKEPVRILYAGALVPPTFDVYRKSDYNFLPLLEELAEVGGCVVDIYNSSHHDSQADRTYEDYLQRYCGSPLSYHRRIPFDTLLAHMSEYHYGWLCLPRRERDLADQRVVICNRFSAYIYGGLPIIIDAEWRFIADLVEEFDAGIVIANPDRDTVLDAIHRADNQRLRAGARALSAHMQQHNWQVISELRSFVREE